MRFVSGLAVAKILTALKSIYTLGYHCFGNFHEAGSVCATDIVDEVVILRDRIFRTARECRP